jgi:hypothetical protein
LRFRRTRFISEFEPIYRDHANLFLAILAPISLPNKVPVGVNGTSTSFALEIVALEDEMLKVRSLEALSADDAQLAQDVSISVAFYRSVDIWPRND